MKKLIISVLLLTGCQTTAQLGNMSQAGMSALSCDQINAAFNAYKQDRNSMDAWVQLVKTINPNVDPYALAGDHNTGELFTEAKNYANIALAVQGCTLL